MLKDDGGDQVATGVSEQFVNDDPSKIPSTVGFAIKQLPAAISANTVFKRTGTTAYSTADHGYTTEGTEREGFVPSMADTAGVDHP